MRSHVWNCSMVTVNTIHGEGIKSIREAAEGRRRRDTTLRPCFSLKGSMPYTISGSIQSKDSNRERGLSTNDSYTCKPQLESQFSSSRTRDDKHAGWSHWLSGCCGQWWRFRKAPGDESLSSLSVVKIRKLGLVILGVSDQLGLFRGDHCSGPVLWSWKS